MSGVTERHDPAVRIYPQQVIQSVYELAAVHPEARPVAIAVDRMIVHLETIINEAGFSASLKSAIMIGKDGVERTGLDKIEHMLAQIPRYIDGSFLDRKWQRSQT